MIQFRCWFCNRAYLKPDDAAGTKFECGCGRRVKVPRRSGGSSKVRSPTDWLVESLVYGGAGALIGFVLSIAIFSRIPLVRRPAEVTLAATAFGLLVGVLFGERGINWIGQKLRDRENG
jgi:xanthosine utilization system XapX-like protein